VRDFLGLVSLLWVPFSGLTGFLLAWKVGKLEGSGNVREFIGSKVIVVQFSCD